MATDSVTSTSSASSASSSSLDNTRRTIADNFDTFLSILTTQLKNQNPLEPLDTNQFTQQLVQFTGVEQQLKTNEFLEALVNAGQSSDLTAMNLANQAVNLIGKSVVAGSDTASLENGAASWTYTVSRAATAQITIQNAEGATVYSGEHTLAAGQGNFDWDGRDSSGLQYPDGEYRISITATDSTGSPVTVLTQVKGIVQSADLTGSVPVLSVDGARVNLEDILSVSQTG